MVKSDISLSHCGLLELAWKLLVAWIIIDRSTKRYTEKVARGFCRLFCSFLCLCKIKCKTDGCIIGLFAHWRLSTRYTGGQSGSWHGFVNASLVIFKLPYTRMRGVKLIVFLSQHRFEGSVLFFYSEIIFYLLETKVSSRLTDDFDAFQIKNKCFCFLLWCRSKPRTLSSSSSRWETTCLRSQTVSSESTRHTTPPRVSASTPRPSCSENTTPSRPRGTRAASLLFLFQAL